MYCRAYIHAPSAEAAVSALEGQFGTARRDHSDYYLGAFEMNIRKNAEYDKNKLCTYPDGFLYYEITAEIETDDEGGIPIMAGILRTLWDNGMPAVISSDHEEEMNEYISAMG